MSLKVHAAVLMALQFGGMFTVGGVFFLLLILLDPPPLVAAIAITTSRWTDFISASRLMRIGESSSGQNS